jgi:hypothetical protein
VLENRTNFFVRDAAKNRLIMLRTIADGKREVGQSR